MVVDGCDLNDEELGESKEEPVNPLHLMVS